MLILIYTHLYTYRHTHTSITIHTKNTQMHTYSKIQIHSCISTHTHTEASLHTRINISEHKYSHIYFLRTHSYILTWEVPITVIGNGHGDTSSNPG